MSQPISVELEGAEWEFVEEPPEVILCGICACVMLEPQLPPCCTQNHLCMGCVQNIRSRAGREKLRGEPPKKPLCPYCRKEDFATVPSVDLQHTILDLYVYCRQKGVGCEWSGRIRDAKSHSSECLLFPICCPNQCGTPNIERQLLPSHLDQCPLQVVECPFSLAGCNRTMQRKDLQLHKKKNVQQHLLQLSEKTANLPAVYAKLKQSLNSKYERLLKSADRSISTLKQQVVETQENISRLKKELHDAEKEITILREERERNDAKYVAELEARGERIDRTREHYRTLQEQLHRAPPMLSRQNYAVLPVTLTLDNFSEQKMANQKWTSPPFYTHIGGYKMCLTVRPNGDLRGPGTHLSHYVHFMRGEFDDGLEWPFQGIVTTLILNQLNFLTRSVASGSTGHCRSIHYFDGSRNNLEYRLRVTDRSYNLGWGCSETLAHTKLGPYVSNNCLKIKVLEIIWLPL